MSENDHSVATIGEGDASERTAAVDEPQSAAVGDAPDASGSTKGRRGRPTGSKRRRRLIEWGSIVLIAAVLALGIRTFVFQAFYIPSLSMAPTFQIGDRILVDKLFFSPADLHTGDVIVFARPPAASCAVGEKDLVKRVIGVPGETVSSRGNTIYVDGKAIAEPYLAPNTPLGPSILPETVYGQHLPSVIPPNEFFVMGDNRADSCDSRYWGYVNGHEIVGKVVLDWWHNHRPALNFF